MTIRKMEVSAIDPYYDRRANDLAAELAKRAEKIHKSIKAYLVVDEGFGTRGFEEVAPRTKESEGVASFVYEGGDEQYVTHAKDILAKVGVKGWEAVKKDIYMASGEVRDVEVSALVYRLPNRDVLVNVTFKV